MTETTLSPHILQEAAAWLLQLQSGALSRSQQLEFEHWRSSSHEHQRAWWRAERLLNQIDSLPPGLAKNVLQRPLPTNRRLLVRSLAALLLAAPLGWLAWRQQDWQNWLAPDYATKLGEQRQLTLADGAQVTLNSETALDVIFDQQRRLLRLRQGEIYITTAPDKQQPARPFLLQSQHGLLQALGTRFSVRQQPDYTLLAVYEGAVQIHLSQAQAPSANIITAGHQVRFDRGAILGVIKPADNNALAWRHGLLVADDLPVQQWANELMRYSRSHIECDPSIGALRVSGSFPINNLPLALGMLAQTYSLRIQRRQQGLYLSR